MINLIWAQGRNGELGLNNQLPWYFPEDLQHFKDTTMGSLVVMGSNTYKSLKAPLPGRVNVVLTRDPNPSWAQPGVWIYHSIPCLLNDVKGRNIFVIGGREIFDAFMRHAHKLHVTHIDKDYIADVTAPPIDLTIWKELHSEKLNEVATIKQYIKN